MLNKKEVELLKLEKRRRELATQIKSQLKSGEYDKDEICKLKKKFVEVNNEVKAIAYDDAGLFKQEEFYYITSNNRLNIQMLKTYGYI